MARLRKVEPERSGDVPPELLDVCDPTWLTDDATRDFYHRNGLGAPRFAPGWPGGRYRGAVSAYARAHGLMNPKYENTPDWGRIYELGIDTKPIPMHLRRMFTA